MELVIITSPLISQYTENLGIKKMGRQVTYLNGFM